MKTFQIFQQFQQRSRCRCELRVGHIVYVNRGRARVETGATGR